MNYKYRLATFFVVSCVFGGAAFHICRFGKETLAWKPTEGTVIDRETGGTNEAVRIHIEYGVGGQTYHLVVTDQFIIKDHITVYYDPNQPGQAVTKPGVNLVELMAWGFLACLGGFAVFAHLAFALWPQLESEESKYKGDIIELDVHRFP